MQEVINRAAVDLNVWRNREERFEKLFPGTLRNNKPFLREKLEYLDSIQAKYRRSDNAEERLTLIILKQERKNLEKIVFPDLFSRLIRAIILPFRQKQTEEAAFKNTDDNLRVLKDAINKAGFTQVGAQLEQRINEGQKEFAIPLSYYVNEKDRVDFNIAFSRHHAGDYQLDGFTASLHSESIQDKTRQHYFSNANDPTLTVEQSINLLAGRSVHKETIDTNGNRLSAWMQLDFNDKDASGNFRMKNFPVTSSYDLHRVVHELPLKEQLSNETTGKLMDALKNGDQHEIMLQNNGKEQKYLIEANPQYRSISIYDGNRRVSLNQKKSEMAARSLKTEANNKNQVHQRRVRKQRPGIS